MSSHPFGSRFGPWATRRARAPDGGGSRGPLALMLLLLSFWGGPEARRRRRCPRGQENEDEHGC
jgi:hypothetical protein